MAYNASSPDALVRRVIVDDLDSAAISYSGTWIAESYVQDPGASGFGSPFQNSLHAVPGHSTSNFSFQYEGSDIDVYGIVLENFDAEWECTVDGRLIRQGERQTSENPRRLLCAGDNRIAHGTHTLEVSVKTHQDIFRFDYLRYMPPPNFQSTRSHLLEVPYDDPLFFFDEHWRQELDFARLTTAPGSSLSFQFSGSSLQWYGFTTIAENSEASRGSYSLNGSTRIEFEIPILSTNGRGSSREHNFKLFEATGLPLGVHNLEVSYEGGGDAPLTLERLIIGRVPSPLPPANLQPQPNINVQPSPAATEFEAEAARVSNTNITAIVGAIMGTLLGLTLIGALVFFFLRHKKRKELPMIQPLPGFVKSNTAAPLDIDLENTRRSDDFGRGMQSRPGSGIPGHARRRSTPRRFNPEIRSTITSDISITAPPMQHASASTMNAHPHRDTMDSTTMGAARRTSEIEPDLTPHDAGYPFAGMQLEDYSKLVSITKKEEERKSRKPKWHKHLSYM